MRLLSEAIDARACEGHAHHGGDLLFRFFVSCRPPVGPAAATVEPAAIRSASCNSRPTAAASSIADNRWSPQISPAIVAGVGAPLATNTLRDPAAELQSPSSVSAVALAGAEMKQPTCAQLADVLSDADEQDLEASAAFAGPGPWTEVHVTSASHWQCYAMDGSKYSFTSFAEYYGNEAADRLWPMAEAVTDSVVCIVEKLSHARHDLQTHAAIEHDSFMDALNVVFAWCNGSLPGLAAASERSNSNPFERLGASLVLPLYFRMFALAECGESFRTPAALPRSTGDAAWKLWRGSFKQHDLKPYQRCHLVHTVGFFP